MNNLCLSCARRKLGGKPPKPCGVCPTLNIDLKAVVYARVGVAIREENERRAADLALRMPK